MKRLDAKPSRENIRNYLNEESGFRHEDIKRFVSFLDKVEAPFSVCIDSPWGDGKTFLVKSVQMILEARNPNISGISLDDLPRWVIEEETMGTEPCAFLPFYFNAWENDMLNNPLGSIVASMAADREIDYEESDDTLCKRAAAVIDSISSIFGYSLNASQFVENFSGTQLVDEYKKRRMIEGEIDKYVEEVLRERAETLVLFVDELDRCRPEYAIRLLTEIKHLSENNRIIIVYSVDLEQLANALEGFYGSSFSTRKYLDRFYDKRFGLKPIAKTHYLNGTTSYVYKEGKFDAIVDELLQASSGTMRDINRIKMDISEARKFAVESRTSSEFEVAFAEAGLLPVLIFLEHERPEVWRELRSARSFEEVYKFGQRSPSFLEFLDCAIANSAHNRETRETEREAYVYNLCCLIFIDESINDQRRNEACCDLGARAWFSFDTKALSLFDFERHNSRSNKR